VLDRLRQPRSGSAPLRPADRWAANRRGSRLT
jgi:hypothetical protein